MRLRPLVVGSAVSVSLLAAFYALAVFFNDAVAVVNFDAAVVELVHQGRAPWVTAAAKTLAAAGSAPAVALGGIALAAVLFAVRRRDDALFSAIVVASGGALSAVAHGSFARSGPPAAEAMLSLPAFGLPAGQSAGSMCLAFAVAYTSASSRLPGAAKGALMAAAASYAVAVGLSGVYLGVLWPSDVIAAWLLAGAIAGAAAGARNSVRAL